MMPYFRPSRSRPITTLGFLAVVVLALAPFERAVAAERWIEEPTPQNFHVEMTDVNGPVFADARGMTVYTWNKDKSGESSCNADRYTAYYSQEHDFALREPERRLACEQVWLPVHAEPNATPVGAWSIITRHDGSRQWAHRNAPLYTYAFDHMPGAVNEVDRDWPAVRENGRRPLSPKLDNPASVMVQVFPQWGRVLTTLDGVVLYSANLKSKNKDGVGAFAPFLMPELARPHGDWSVVTLKDGSQQWAYLGRPLFYPVSEKTRVEAPPDFIAEGGWRAARLIDEDISGWSPVIVQTAPTPPDGVIVQRTSAGDVLADSRGHTLYAMRCTERTPDELACDNPGASGRYHSDVCGAWEACEKTWPRLLAGPNAKSNNRTWSIAAIDRTTGRFASTPDKNTVRIWLYRGHPLYMFSGDLKPGDITAQFVNEYDVDYYYLRVLSTSSDYDPSRVQ